MTTTVRSAIQAFVVAFGLALIASACANTPIDQAPRAAPSTSSSIVGGGLLPTVDKPSSDQVPLPWGLNRIDAARNRIYLAMSGRDCSLPQAVALSETAESITITAWGSKPSATPCTDQLTTIVGFVSPTRPIGTRSVVHGS